MNDYCICKDSIMFKPKFDKPLDIYVEVIKKYKKLIFSNYNDFDIYVKTNNKFISKYTIKFIRSKFNQPLENSLSNLINLTHLTFGFDFNCSLANSLSNLINLTHLTFSYRFNKPLEKSLSNLTNLTNLTFGDEFNHPLSNSLSNLTNLTHLTIGHKFNQLLELPSSIKILSIDCNNLYLIENLPNSVEELYLGKNFNLELNNLPNSIKKIKFDTDSNYNKELNNLPKFLELLELSKYYPSYK